MRRAWLGAGRLSFPAVCFQKSSSLIELDHNRGRDPGETAAALLADFWHLLEKRNFYPKAISSVGAPAEASSNLGLEGAMERLHQPLTAEVVVAQIRR